MERGKDVEQRKGGMLSGVDRGTRDMEEIEREREREGVSDKRGRIRIDKRYKREKQRSLQK